MAGINTEMVDCPQCGLPAQKDEYYVIGEERTVCNWCGYNHVKSVTGKRSSKGYGSIHYVPKNESQNGSNQIERIVRLKSPLQLLDRHRIVMDIEKNYDHDKSSFYVWNEATKALECLMGARPKTIGEVYQEQCDEAEYYRQLGHSQMLEGEEYEEF